MDACAIYTTAPTVSSSKRDRAAMFSNPGAVPVHSKPTNPAFYSTECYKCNNFKPPRAHHCSACNRCIIKVSPVMGQYR